ncbi:MAG TPA: bifunctional metallophosphatase/5'-nucleotidase, partial [Phaeodactylibacter sp.]|nr:bifunctional metallophosphatase/5'-nucleotidase [Phaeodactylibacter sp.]
LGFAPNADYTPLSTNDDATIGGFSRVAHVIRTRRAKAPERTLVLDGGDWMMGTLFQSISTFEGAELRLMQTIGYDAAVIGNHEFDFHCDGLADIIESAMKHGDIPQLLLSNANFDAQKKGDDRIKSLFDQKIIDRYSIITKNGLRIGMFGLLGKDAVSVASYSKPMTFDDPIQTAKKMTAFLKSEKKVDVVICLTHSGIRRVGKEEPWHGEDIDLAKAVPDIDIVISGHSHTTLHQPIMINGTPIVQAGSKGQFVGVLEMQFNDKEIQMTDYQLVKVDDSFETEADINAMIDTFKQTIDEKILNKYAISFTDTLLEMDFDLTIEEGQLNESNLGRFAADAVRYGVQKYSDKNGIPTVGFTTAGLIRDNLLAGKKGFQQVSDLFRVMPLGRGTLDDTPGYPLTKAYVTPAELKSILEILLIAPSVKGNSRFPYFSGLRFRYNPNRIPLDQIFEIELGDPQNGYHLLDLSSNDLVGVGANFYILESFGLINELSKGLLTVVPKHADGSPIQKPIDALLDFSKKEKGVQEVKEWSSLFELTKSFLDSNGNGVPDIPNFYKKTEIRQIAVPSWNPKYMYMNATKVMWGASGIGLFVLGLVAWVVRKIKRRFSS